MNVSTEPDVSTGEVSSAASAASSRRLLTLHALAFVIATGINAIIDAADGGGWRIHWMLLGWGIGLACHAALVVSRPSPGRRSRRLRLVLLGRPVGAQPPPRPRMTNVAEGRPYRIELDGRVSDRMLAPFLDEFTVVARRSTTVLSGEVRDSAHLHGVITHLTGVGLEIVSIRPANRPTNWCDDRPVTPTPWRPV